MELLEGNKLKPVAHWPVCYNQQQGFVCLLCKGEKLTTIYKYFDVKCRRNQAYLSAEH